jgi:hypothetical protein
MKEIKIIIHLIEALAWPGVVLYIVISFHAPLKNLLEQLAKKFSEASKSKFSFGSLSLELESRLQQQGAGNLAETARKLSRGAFDLILRLGDTNHTYGFGSNVNNLYYLPDYKMTATVLELNQARLLNFPEPPEEFLRFVQTHSLVKHIADPSGTNVLGHVVLPKEGLTDVERNRIEHMNFRLNEEGKRVHDALLEILLVQLSGSEQN